MNKFFFLFNIHDVLINIVLNVVSLYCFTVIVTSTGTIMRKCYIDQVVDRNLVGP